MMQQFSKHVVRGKGEASMTVSVSSANRISAFKVNIVKSTRNGRIAEAKGLKHDHGDLKMHCSGALTDRVHTARHRKHNQLCTSAPQLLFIPIY